MLNLNLVRKAIAGIAIAGTALLSGCGYDHFEKADVEVPSEVTAPAPTAKAGVAPSTAKAAGKATAKAINKATAPAKAKQPGVVQGTGKGTPQQTGKAHEVKDNSKPIVQEPKAWTAAEVAKLGGHRIKTPWGIAKQVNGIQAGGQYTAKELNIAAEALKKGCNVEEDLSISCSADQYVLEGTGETVKEAEDKSGGFDDGKWKAVSEGTTRQVDKH